MGTKKSANPTDQARKEARRKELKKNKKQRLQVRQAVIKQKDPKHIFAEMESIDKMEYDSNNPPTYSVRVLQDKRRKLRETFLKIYSFYQREDVKQASELKTMELDYERRRTAMMQNYESIMQAQHVKLDDIPLPDLPMSMPADITDSSIINNKETGTLSDLMNPKSILKQTIKPLPTLVSSSYDTEKQPPGPPSGQPPNLDEFECDNDEFELGLTLEEAYKSNEKPKKIRFEQNIPPMNHLVPPPPPPVTASTIQQSLIRQNLNRMPPPIPNNVNYQSRNNNPQSINQKQQGYYQQQKNPLSVSNPVVQAQPVLRNKHAEITRFVPTALTVKRDTNKKPAPSSSQQTFVPSHTISTSNQSGGGPFNYMLHQQQQYATLNPLPTYKSALTGSSPLKGSSTLTSSMSKIHNSNNISSQQSISVVAAPTVVKPIDTKDAAYDKFMKEMEGLL